MKLIRDHKLKTLKGWQKLQYIWDYYKLPIALIGIMVYIAIYIAYRHFSYKETILYTALVNVNAGQDLTQNLDQDFLDYLELDTSQNKIQLYTKLYLTDDEMNAHHQYSYASRMKILASIDGGLLDVALMDQEAFDAFSQNGYLCDLEELLSLNDPDLYDAIQPHLSTNIIILEDNAIDAQLDPSIPYHAATEEHILGINLSKTGLIGRAGFESSVYLGIIANSPRKDTAIAYLRYLSCI